MKSIFLIISILINVALIQAQKPNETGSCNPLIKVYFFDSYGVIYQFDKTDNSSYRLNVDLSTNGFDSEHEYFIISQDTMRADTDDDSDQIQFTLLVSPHYYINLMSSGYFNLYVEGGPYFLYGYSNFSSSSVDIYDNLERVFRTFSSSTNRYETGLVLFMGAEGKINDNVGIFSEFELSGGRSWSVSESESSIKFPDQEKRFYADERTTYSWSYYLSKVKVGVYMML